MGLVPPLFHNEKMKTQKFSQETRCNEIPEQKRTAEEKSERQVMVGLVMKTVITGARGTKFKAYLNCRVQHAFKAA